MGGVRASLWRMIAIAITSLRDLGDVIVGPGVVPLRRYLRIPGFRY